MSTLFFVACVQVAISLSYVPQSACVTSWCVNSTFSELITCTVPHFIQAKDGICEFKGYLYLMVLMVLIF